MDTYFDSNIGLTITILPCGSKAVVDTGGCYGLRCVECSAIWGSIGCRCSNELSKKDGGG